MGRIYPVTFEQVSISAVQDIFELYFGSSIYKSLKILRHWFEVADPTLPASGFLALRSRVLPSVVSHGSGGVSAKIGNALGGDSAPSFTAKANNITKATTTGTASIEYEGGFHLYQGNEWMYRKPPILIGGTGSSFVFELISAPAAGILFSGGIEVEEDG